MTNKEKVSAGLFIAMLFIVHHYFFYPPVVEEDRTEDALYEIGQLVASGNSAKVQQAVMRYLDDNVQIRLDVTYGVMDEEAVQNNKPAVTYNFNKRLFMAYLDNLLRSLTSFTFNARLADFNISSDWKTGDAIIMSAGGAQGASRFMTKLRTARFSYDALCEATLSLEGSRPAITVLNCKLFTQQPQPLS
jgi:hypothetical protein